MWPFINSYLKSDNFNELIFFVTKMLLQPIVIVAVVFWAVKTDAGDLIETEQNKLERNLKILRKDFNEIIENVEDFVADFLKQMREAGE